MLQMLIMDQLLAAARQVVRQLAELLREAGARHHGLYGGREGAAALHVSLQLAN